MSLDRPCPKRMPVIELTSPSGSPCGCAHTTHSSSTACTARAARMHRPATGNTAARVTQKSLAPPAIATQGAKFWWATATRHSCKSLCQCGRPLAACPPNELPARSTHSRSLISVESEPEAEPQNSWPARDALSPKTDGPAMVASFSSKQVGAPLPPTPNAPSRSPCCPGEAEPDLKRLGLMRRSAGRRKRPSPRCARLMLRASTVAPAAGAPIKVVQVSSRHNRPQNHAR